MKYEYVFAANRGKHLKVVVLNENTTQFIKKGLAFPFSNLYTNRGGVY